MVDIDILMFYDENPDFKRFVDRNAKQYRKSPAYIMETPTAKEYFKSLQKGGCNARNEQQ